jgi:hypothetical protein
MVSCSRETEVPKSIAMAGIDGTYTLVENCPIVATAARYRTTPDLGRGMRPPADKASLESGSDVMPLT